jgi:hypothetical protein
MSYEEEVHACVSSWRDAHTNTALRAVCVVPSWHMDRGKSIADAGRLQATHAATTTGGHGQSGVETVGNGRALAVSGRARTAVHVRLVRTRRRMSSGQSSSSATGM